MRITGHSLNILSDEEVGLIHQGALRILSEMGMEVQNEELLLLLREYGLNIDLLSQRVRFPPILVEQFIAEAEKYCWQDHQPSLDAEAGIYLSLYHDPVTQELVPWTEERLAFYSSFARSLPNVGKASMLGCRMPTPALLEPLYERFYNWKYGNEEGGSIHIDEICPYLYEIYKVRASFVGKPVNEIFRGSVYLVPPMKLGRHEAYQVMYFWKRGMQVKIGDMFALGSSAPVTLAGAVTLNLAEQIALRIVEGNLFGTKRLHIGGSIAVLDMRTTFYRSAPPERSLAHLMTAQMARFYGASFSGHALLTDAKEPTFEAGAQKAMNSLLLLLAGGNIWYPVGLLSADEICSPIQMVLDNEIIDILKHYQKVFEVNEDSLGVDVILEAGPGGHFLDKDHTLKYFKRVVWHPGVFSQQMLRGWMEAGGEHDVDRARQQVLDFMKRIPEPTHLSEEQNFEILKVIEDAKKMLID
jgi:trimethylamine--corrinoid protein Co-methyltransferase